MRVYSALLLAALTGPLSAFAADQGEVVWVDPSCNHFIAKVGEEFGTYNWRSGNAPQVGDHLEGDLLTLEGGVRELSNTTARGANTVYIVALGPEAVCHDSHRSGAMQGAVPRLGQIACAAAARPCAATLARRVHGLDRQPCHREESKI